MQHTEVEWNFSNPKNFRTSCKLAYVFSYPMKTMWREILVSPFEFPTFAEKSKNYPNLDKKRQNIHNCQQHLLLNVMYLKLLIIFSGSFWLKPSFSLLGYVLYQSSAIHAGVFYREVLSRRWIYVLHKNRRKEYSPVFFIVDQRYLNMFELIESGSFKR